ncbi:hypothetical protein F2P56_007436 [Juglans regia]|uniref:Uncharacterized protein LOC108988375 isoform X2 n=2 Tax=Juglans regia TaxID=51240 RepID=A0A2I4ECP3_JUGRE|nr:uncharacterized protein LOC108988375 isoform X2 [Juglans regia]KAF5475656.1 hypothetical protein F2P56_007436 [Juglans regia]
MKKPDQTRLSSSSYRENIAPETLHSKSIGCMSGIVNLVSKYHNRRKFLTFGKKQEKINAISSPAKPKPASSVSTTQASPSVVLQEQSAKEGEDAAVDLRKLSSDMQRSPTLPAEMRRSKSSNSSQHFRNPPALMARLMGLEGMPESAAEKRRKLLGALEKCNEDLNALRKIIESVQFSERLKSTDAGQHVDGETNRLKRCSEFNNGEQQQPSPVSVLDEFTPSPSSTTGQYCHSGRHANGSRLVLQQHQKQLRKKPGDQEETTKIYFNDRMINITTETVVVERKVSDNVVGSIISSIWNSKAMIESVEEVCRDIDWGKRREIGRIGLALQDHICRDLIEEMVGEMQQGCCCMLQYALPLEACKRRLCF